MKSKATKPSNSDKAARASIKPRSISGERIAHLVKGIRLQLQTRAVRGGIAPISGAVPAGRVGRIVDGHLTLVVSEVVGGDVIALIACSLLTRTKG
jgi:hypothetical protein